MICFLLAYVLAYSSNFVCQPVESKMTLWNSSNNSWYTDVTKYNSDFLFLLSRWYAAVAARFCGCVIGAVLSVMEYEVPLIVSDVDFATPKDRFV